VDKKYISVFCSASDLKEKYVGPAREFARLMGENGYHLVYGGSDVGLMKVVADEVAKSGKDLVGVSIEVFAGVSRENLTESIVSNTLAERRITMLARGNAVVALTGGMGTLDEITEVMELKKQGKHGKPVIILNTDHFYDGLRIQLQKMQDEGFMHKNLNDLVYFANTPKEAIDYINSCLG
jgi:uncharacterized protein (TIGR00730 family)